MANPVRRKTKGMRETHDTKLRSGYLWVKAGNCKKSKAG
jgi:hypothetical protein